MQDDFHEHLQENINHVQTSIGPHFYSEIHSLTHQQFEDLVNT